MTNALPRKSSRTSTHAVTVPKNAFVSAARAATASVSFNAATASRFETASQKFPDAPVFVDDQISAAIGNATTSDRNTVTKPRERAVPAPSLRMWMVLRPGKPGALTWLARGRASDSLLDLGSSRKWPVIPQMLGLH